jgi:hypothetical protein
MFKELVAGAKAKPVLMLWFAVNFIGMVAMVVLGGYKIATLHSPLHLLWFIPTIILVAIIAMRDGYRVNKEMRAKLNE